MLPDDYLFSELLEPLNAMDDTVLPGAIDAMCDSLLFSDMPLFDNEFESIFMDPWHTMSSGEGSLDFDDDSVLIRDCMWTSNAADKELLKIKAEPLIEMSILGLPIDAIIPGSTNKGTENYVRNCAPYSINNDHCYFIHREEPVVKIEPEDSDQETQQESPKDSDTSDSETSGDEVDIETVREDKHGLCSIKLKRTLLSNNQWSCRRQNQTSKSRGNKSVRLDTAAVKAKLVQAKQLQLSGKCIARTNRRRRPANSLNTSSGNSSDTEEPVKRKMHNSMERLRRQQQRSALHSLREQIPELRNDFKAPKVKILEVGTAYIKQMERLSSGLAQRKRRLQDRQRELQKKLEMLKRHHR